MPRSRTAPEPNAIRTTPTRAAAAGASENVVAALVLAPRERRAAPPRALACAYVLVRCGRNNPGGAAAIDVSGV